MSATTGDPQRTAVAAQPYTRSQRLTLLACILGSSAAFLDGTIVNVALPAIRASVHGGLETQEWVVDAYLLTLGALLLVGGSLGDVFGRRRIFAWGVGGFGVASLACAIAPDAAFLIGARAVQGIAAALLVPSNLALIMDNFSERQRAAAIGTWTAWTGIATVAGPLLGSCWYRWRRGGGCSSSTCRSCSSRCGWPPRYRRSREIRTPAPIGWEAGCWRWAWPDRSLR